MNISASGEVFVRSNGLDGALFQKHTCFTFYKNILFFTPEAAIFACYHVHVTLLLRHKSREMP